MNGHLIAAFLWCAAWGCACRADTPFPPKPVTEVEFSRHLAILGYGADDVDRFLFILDHYLEERRRLERSLNSLFGWLNSLQPREYDAADDQLKNAVFDHTLRMTTTYQRAFRSLEELAYLQPLSELPGAEDGEMETIRRHRLRSWKLDQSQLSAVVLLGAVDVDFAVVARDLNIDGADAVQEALLRWEIELDGYLRELDHVHIHLDEQRSRAFRPLTRSSRPDGSPPSPEAIEEAARISARPSLICLSIRDLNRRTLSLIANSLPLGERADFLREGRLAMYPFFRSEMSPPEILKRVNLLGTLTSEQRSALNRIKQSYEAELAATVEKTEAIVSQFLTRDSVLSMYGLQLPGFPPQRQQPMNSWYTCREALDGIIEEWRLAIAHFSDEAISILTPEQKEAIR